MGTGEPLGQGLCVAGCGGLSKRAFGKFKRRKQDAYDTPASCVMPLLPHLRGVGTFIEPCAGKGQLARVLCAEGLECVRALDVEPRHPGVRHGDALTADFSRLHADAIITNPPWTREIMHPMIEHFQKFAPTWLLFDADWAHTKQAVPFLDQCTHIVSVGRVSWMENGTSGLDNCAWYRFDKQHEGGPRFFGQVKEAA